MRESIEPGKSFCLAQWTPSLLSLVLIAESGSTILAWVQLQRILLWDMLAQDDVAVIGDIAVFR